MPSSYDQIDLRINQTVPGVTELSAGFPGYSMHVVNYLVVMAATGTFSFTDGTDLKTGDIPILTNGGVAESATSKDPLFSLGRGRPLQIITTGGTAHGRVRVELR